MSKHKQSGPRGRTCACGEMFVSVMDLNDHIEQKTGKNTPDYEVKQVFP